MILTQLEELALRDLIRDGGSAVRGFDDERQDWVTYGLKRLTLDARAITQLLSKGYVTRSGRFIQAHKDADGNPFTPPRLKSNGVGRKQNLGWLG